MKAGWETKCLGDFAAVSTGPFGSILHKSDYVDDGVPLVNPINIVDDSIVPDTSKLISDETIKRLSNYVLDEGDVVVARRGEIGRCAVVGPNEKGWVCGTGSFFVRPSPNLNSRFLALLIRSPEYRERLENLSTGTTMKNLSNTVLSSLAISVPSLPEQQRIVTILDEAFDGIATAKANAEKNLQNARALFESHLQSVFTERGEGWVEKKVSEIAKHSLGKMLDKAKNKGEPQPYLRNINVRWFTFDLSDLLEMPFLPTEAEKYTAVKGDVLICEGGYPGRAAIWNEDYPIYFQTALHRVRFQEPELNKWFVYYLSVQASSGQLKQHFSGTGIQHFTGEVLARFPIPVPPLPELRLAVAKFDALSDETQRLESIYRQKLTALDDLKKSLLHQAFSGQL